MSAQIIKFPSSRRPPRIVPAAYCPHVARTKTEYLKNPTQETMEAFMRAVKARQERYMAMIGVTDE